MSKKDTFWFSHDYNARSDRKLLKLRMKHGMEGIGAYWCIVEMLYQEGGFLSINDYERITFELRSNNDTITSVINNFDLFEKNSETFWSNSVLNRLKIRADKSEKARNSIKERWEKERAKKHTNVSPSYNDRNTIKDNTIINNNKVKHGGENNQQINGDNTQGETIWATNFMEGVPKGKQG